MALLTSGKTYSYTSGKEPSSAYFPDTGTVELTDGNVTGDTYGAENVGWLSNGILGGNGLLEFTMDLEAEYSLSSVRFYIMSDGGGVVGPETLVVSGSTNGTDFTQIGSFSVAGGDWDVSAGTRWSNDLSVSGSYRYVRFYMVGYQPDGGYKNWSFIREAEVYGDTAASV